jgi:hypothetical protein
MGRVRIRSHATITVTMLTNGTVQVAAYGPSDAKDKSAEAWCEAIVKLVSELMKKAAKPETD